MRIIISIYISSITQVERSVDIFSKYTYNEQATQYLMYPYDYFALDLDIDFMIPCIETPSELPDFMNLTADNTEITADTELYFADHT
jgi:UDP-3-O-acyl-N-acetylglucosamine deacetylase